MLRLELERRPEIVFAYLNGSFLVGGPYRDIDVWTSSMPMPTKRSANASNSARASGSRCPCPSSMRGRLGLSPRTLPVDVPERAGHGAQITQEVWEALQEFSDLRGG